MPAARGYDGQKPVAMLAHIILASTVLGYASLQAKQIAKGREFRPVVTEDGEFQGGELFMASLLQGGGLGIYGDFLFGEANRNGLGFTIGSLGGPAVSELERLATIIRKTASGDPDQLEDVPADLINGVKANTPFLNLFYVRAALDYLVFYRMQEAVSPGSVERYEKRVEKDTGAGFIWSSGTFAGSAANGVRSGVSVKQSNIGEALASNTFIGRMPRICSIVRSTLVVLYCVDTVTPRLANGLAT